MTPGSSTHPPSSMLLLARLAKQVMRRSSPEMLGMDLRLLMALNYFGDHDGAPQHQLAETLCMDANNVVLLLNELEDSGLLVRRRDPDDRRRHRVYVTAAGREALERAARAQEQIEDEVLRALSDEERAVLWQLLTRAVQSSERAAVADQSQVVSAPAG